MLDNTTESLSVIPYVLGISGTVILLLLTVVGFFLARIISDVKNNTSDIGKNKGKIELVEQQQQNDVKRVEEMTQLELKTLSISIKNQSDNVSELSNNVNSLVSLLAKKGIDKLNEE